MSRTFHTLGNDTVDVFFDNLYSRSTVTVESDRAVLSGIMQIVTSAVRALSSRESCGSWASNGSASQTYLTSYARWSTRQKLYQCEISCLCCPRLFPFATCTLRQVVQSSDGCYFVLIYGLFPHVQGHTEPFSFLQVLRACHVVCFTRCATTSFKFRKRKQSIGIIGGCSVSHYRAAAIDQLYSGSILLLPSSWSFSAKG